MNMKKLILLASALLLVGCSTPEASNTALLAQLWPNYPSMFSISNGMDRDSVLRRAGTPIRVARFQNLMRDGFCRDSGLGVDYLLDVIYENELVVRTYRYMNETANSEFGPCQNSNEDRSLSRIKVLLEQERRARSERELADARRSSEATRYQAQETARLGLQCLDFGFKDNTDELDNCIAQLRLAAAQAEIIRSQAASIDAARRAEQIEREAAERQRAFGRALLGISAGILNPGRSSNSGNMFQTCNYNVLGEIVPYPVSSASICPPTRNFGGTVGILQ